MNISIHQACKVWNDLRDAMEGKASHGHETEIYAYTLMPFMPIENVVERIRAAKSLVELIDLFRETYTDCYALIDGLDYHSWLDKVQDGFDHRVKVEIRSLNRDNVFCSCLTRVAIPKGDKFICKYCGLEIEN